MTARPRSRPDFGALKPLLPFVWRYRGRLLVALVALVVAAAATLAIPLAVRRVVDFGFTPESRGLIAAYFGVLLMVVGVLAAGSAARYYFVMTIGERVVADLRLAVFAHLTRLDAAFYDRTLSGELVSRLSADTTQIKAVFGAAASVALRNVMLFVGAVILMVATSPALSALVLLLIPLIVVPLIVAGRGVSRRAKAAQDALAETSAYATEQVGAARTMQAFGAEGRAVGRYAAAVEHAYDTARGTLLARALLTAVAIFIVFAGVIGVLWLGAQAVIDGTMSGGRLAQFILYAVFAASALSQLSEVWSELSAASGAAARLAELLATRPAVEEPAAPVPLPRPPRGALAFEGVHFAYPSRPEDSALAGVSFSIAPGERVAIVGPSGAGKSTVFGLILRHYDPQAGTVRLDGVDLRQASLAEVRARVAMVAQEPVIFSGTIADNLRYARPEASDADLRRAAEQASALGFIEALPEGFGARVGERGITLSGGERQRLAIARAILKDAPVLLLDEATSALDAENEAAVQAALDRLMVGRTTIVVAHRLATVLKADRILVLQDGRIVEEGGHHALVARGGLYARLAELQFGTARAA